MVMVSVCFTKVVALLSVRSRKAKMNRSPKDQGHCVFKVS